MVRRRLVAVAPGEDAHVDVRCCDVGKAFVDRSNIGRDVAFHLCHAQAGLLQLGEHSRPVFPQVFERRGKIHPELLQFLPSVDQPGTGLSRRILTGLGRALALARPPSLSNPTDGIASMACRSDGMKRAAA